MAFMDLLPSVTFWAACFSMMLFLIEKHLRTPFKIGQIENKHQQKIAKWEYISNVGSIVHAVCSFFWGFYLLKTFGIRNASQNLDDENSLMAFSLGYFSVDTAFGAYYAYNDYVMNCHHAETIISLFYVLVKNRYAGSIVWALWAAEASNPLILLKKNLDRHRNTERVSTFVGILFCIIFLCTRTYLVGSLLLPLQESPTSMFMKIHGGLLCELKRVYLALLVLHHHQQAGERAFRREIIR